MSQTAEREAAELLVRFFKDTHGEFSEEFSSVPGGERSWEGPLGFEGLTTSDRRYLMPGEIGERDLPLPLAVQTVSAEGHEGSQVAGRIESIRRIPMSEFDRAEEFGLDGVPDTATVIFGSGVLDGSPAAEEGARMIENGAGVSLDITRDRMAVLDESTLEEIPEEEVDLAKALSGEYVTGIGGKIGGATIVMISAFEQSAIRFVEDGVLVASAVHLKLAPAPTVLTAAATGPKPDPSYFANPNLKRLTPLTITEPLADGYRRVYGHLADWSGCHTGFSNICVPPFRSTTDFAYFNVGEIECADGALMPIGKLMFSMEDIGHANEKIIDWQAAAKHYDKAAKIGAFVRAGSDRFGTWLAGVLRPGLTEDEVMYLRANPPSGDWRPIPGKGSELIAAFSVPVPGFPIPRALVASAGVDELTIITAPLVIEKPGPKEIRRRMEVLRARREALTAMESTAAFALEGDAFRDVSTSERKRLAKTGAAMPDGSFPIANCSDAKNARQAIGRTSPGKRDRVMAHIRRRERSLGCGSGD